MAKTYIAHRSAKRMGILLAFLAVIGLLMLTIDLSFLLPDPSESFRAARRASRLETLLAVLPWVGGVALIVALAFLPTLLRKRVEIEVSGAGIVYPPALNDTLPWDRIERVAVRKMALARVLAVTIRDAEDFPIKPMARKVAELNRTTGDYGDINIETLRSDGDFDELVAAVETYVPVEPMS